MLLLSILVLGLIGIGGVCLIRAIKTAPVGFEGDGGFEFGIQSSGAPMAQQPVFSTALVKIRRENIRVTKVEREPVAA